MNLQYPLNESYTAYSHIEIIKLKDKNKILIIGCNTSENEYSCLMIKKQKANEPLLDLADLVVEVGPYPSQEYLKQQLKQIIGDYQIKQTFQGEGILGFHRFLQGYYLHYIVEKESIAKIGRHKVNEILKTNILALFEPRNQRKDDEKKYREILEQYKVENFYYSCSYDMTYSLAKNMVETSKPFYQYQGSAGPAYGDSFYGDSQNLFGICELFHFNYGIVKELTKKIVNRKWILSVVHGYCKQINVNFKGTVFNIIVIARRCRHHAGTRYIKRGINGDGFVANYVEVEQIVVNYSLSQDTRPVCSSFIQMRGSVPTYWMQRPSIAIPKPNIQIRTNDYLYSATRKHFHDLFARYGQFICCVNLMKLKQKTVRESGLSKQYREAVQFINKNDLKQDKSIHYIEIDMKYNLKLDKNMFVNKIRTLAFYGIQKTGMFLCFGIDRNTNDQYIEFQNGVIRANCVDCLDRTNSFQQLVGETVLSVQLSRLLKQQTKFQNLELDNRIMEMYSELYERMGDLISIQYGSSYAHKQKIQKTTESRNQFWTSIKRHFNNNWKDYDRQQQIDLFLGYRPDPDSTQLWEVKPSIEHFPSKRVKSFEQKQNGLFQEAYAFFKNEYCFDFLEKINNKAKSQLSWLNKTEKFDKQDLKKKFTADIVNALVNDKQLVQKFKFCLSPKMLVQKRSWKQMNPEPKQIQTLQQKLSYQYNKMQFLREQIKSQNIYQLTNKKQLDQQPSTMQTPGRRKIKGQPVQATQGGFLLQCEQQVREAMAAWLGMGDKIDGEQKELIEKCCRGEFMRDGEIMEEILKLEESGGVEAEAPQEGFGRLRALAEEEIKLMEANYLSGNFVMMTRKKKKREGGQGKKIVETEKKDKIKDNKVMMLQQLMQNNFTHGKIKGQVTQL